MQVISSEKNQYVLSFARGEELLSAFVTWARDNKIAGATFSGLGAADQLELAYYHLPTKTYERQTLDEEVEILSLNGNLGTLYDKQALHMHGVFGRRDLSAFGGHVFKLRVSGACEIHVHTLSETLRRMYDANTGLNLLCQNKMA